MSKALRSQSRSERHRLDAVRETYRRFVANWAHDLLGQPPRGRAAWPSADPVGDFHDRDWRRLYAGSVLDD